MSPLTQEHLDAQIDQVLRTVKSGFDSVGVEFSHVADRFTAQRQYMAEQFASQRQEIGSVKESLTSLYALVDRFAKIYTDLNQELVVMRQQLRDVEERIGKLELTLKAA